MKSYLGAQRRLKRLPDSESKIKTIKSSKPEEQPASVTQGSMDLQDTTRKTALTCLAVSMEALMRMGSKGTKVTASNPSDRLSKWYCGQEEM